MFQFDMASHVRKSLVPIIAPVNYAKTWKEKIRTD